MKSIFGTVLLTLLLIGARAEGACVSTDVAGYWEGTASTLGNGVSIAPAAVRLKLDIDNTGSINTSTSFGRVLAPYASEDYTIHVVPGSYLAVWRPEDCRVLGIFSFYELPGVYYQVNASMNPSLTMMVGIIRGFDGNQTLVDSGTFTNMKM